MPQSQPITIDIEIVSKNWREIKNIKKLVESRTIELIKLSPLQKFLAKKNFRENFRENSEDNSKGVCFGISISLSSNRRIKKINAQFRNIDKPTDILSFGTLDEKLIQKHGLKKAIGNDKYIYLGDLVLSYEYIVNDAKAQNKSLENHLTHLILHGILHLIGHDHEESESAKIMEDLEIKILKKLNINNPYHNEIIS